MSGGLWPPTSSVALTRGAIPHSTQRRRAAARDAGTDRRHEGPDRLARRRRCHDRRQSGPGVRRGGHQSVPVTNVADEAQLEAAVKSAVDDVLEHAIAFTPTVVTLESVRVVGNQIYLLLLIADRDGEKSIEALSALEPSQEEPADLSGGITRLLTH